MKNKSILKIITVALFALLLIFNISLIAQAADESSQTGVVWLGIPSQCLECGNCSLCDIMNVAINIGKFVIGIIGSIIFVYFIYGGIVMLTSGGDSTKINKGKSILINSVIGLAIVMFAYFFVFIIVLVASGGNVKAEDLINPQINCSAAPACPSKNPTPTTPTTQP